MFLAGCASPGVRPVNNGQAYVMGAARAEYICEEAVKAMGESYLKESNGIGFETTSIFVLDRNWHNVRATPVHTASGEEAYSFSAGWRGSAPATANSRQKRINQRLAALLAQETPVGAHVVTPEKAPDPEKTQGTDKTQDTEERVRELEQELERLKRIRELERELEQLRGEGAKAEQ
jgi:hypothetical protein